MVAPSSESYFLLVFFFLHDFQYYSDIMRYLASFFSDSRFLSRFVEVKPFPGYFIFFQELKMKSRSSFFPPPPFHCTTAAEVS